MNRRSSAASETAFSVTSQAPWSERESGLTSTAPSIQSIRSVLRGQVGSENPSCHLPCSLSISTQISRSRSGKDTVWRLKLIPGLGRKDVRNILAVSTGSTYSSILLKAILNGSYREEARAADFFLTNRLLIYSHIASRKSKLFGLPGTPLKAPSAK